VIHLDDDAIARALNLEINIEADLLDHRKSIILAQLATARGTAIEAVKALIEADPFDARAIMALQNDVGRFSSLVKWLLNAQTRAAEAFAQLPPEEQEAVAAFANPHSEINDA
jgi:hypothetical protein